MKRVKARAIGARTQRERDWIEALSATTGTDPSEFEDLVY